MSAARVLDHPLESLFELPRLVDRAVHPIEQLLGLELAVGISLEEMQERRVDLHLVDES